MTYAKDEVYVVKFGFERQPVRIKRANEQALEWCTYPIGLFERWETHAEFNKHEPIYVGRVRRFLGIPIGLVK